jgi:hypothetical protein
MTYCQTWGFGENDFKSRQDDYDGMADKDHFVTNRFVCAAEISDVLLPFLREPMQKTCKCYKLSGDYDEFSFHAVSHMLQEDNVLAFPIVDEKIIVLVEGVFEAEKVKSALNLEFIEVSIEAEDMPSPDTMIRYLIRSSLVWVCLNDGWKSVSTVEEESNYGTFGRENEAENTFEVCTIEIVIVNNEGWYSEIKTLIIYL